MQSRSPKLKRRGQGLGRHGGTVARNPRYEKQEVGGSSGKKLRKATEGKKCPVYGQIQEDSAHGQCTSLSLTKKEQFLEGH